MSSGMIVAVCLTAISLGSLVLFVAGAFNAGSHADDLAEQDDVRWINLLGRDDQ